MHLQHNSVLICEQVEHVTKMNSALSENPTPPAVTNNVQRPIYSNIDAFKLEHFMLGHIESGFIRKLSAVILLVPGQRRLLRLHNAVQDAPLSCHLGHFIVIAKYQNAYMPPRSSVSR